MPLKTQWRIGDFMTKILVLSDSHRNFDPMVQAVELEKPDMIIHLGDHYKDAMSLHGVFPDIPLHAVSGNCDSERSESEKMIVVEGKKILLCHGHEYGVKSGYLNLQYAAREKGADIVLFGHTHQVFYDQTSQLAMLNPGSIGEPRYYGKNSYGILIIENGQLFINTYILRQG